MSSEKQKSICNKQSGMSKMQSAFWALVHGLCRQQPVLSELLQSCFALQKGEDTLQILSGPCYLCGDCKSLECSHNEA